MRTIVTTVVLIVSLALLAACGPTAAAPPTSSPATGCPSALTTPDGLTSVGVVVGRRANSTHAPLPVLACYLDPVLERPAHVIVATSDGRPRAVLDEHLVVLPEGRRRTDARAAFNQRLVVALDAPAQAPEADALEAIALVAHGQRGDGAGPRRIVIDDSMLQTTGTLPLQAGYLYADPEDVVAELRPYLRRTLGDLHGTQVVLVALGATAPPQPDVDSNNRARLLDLWTSLLTSVGASVVVDPGTVRVGDLETSDRPPVTVVPMRPPTTPTVASTTAARDRWRVEVHGTRDSIEFRRRTRSAGNPW